MPVLIACKFDKDPVKRGHCFSHYMSMGASCCHGNHSFDPMRKDTREFAKEKYFNGHSDTRSVQENFDLLTFFIQDSADKHIPSKTSRSVSSIPWITPAIRRKIRRKNKTHAKAKKTGSSQLRSKFETLRRKIKADVRKQHDLYVNK